MPGLAQLVIDLSVNSAKFVSGINEANRSLNKMKSDIGTIKFASLAYIAREVANLTQQFYAFGRAIASTANDIERQAGIVGMSISEWQKWSYAAKMADASTEGLMTGMKFLSQNIMESKKEGSEAANIFKALGITGSDLQGVFLQLADRFSKSADGADKITYATKLFGRGAMELIPLLNKGSGAIKGWSEEAVKMGTILGDVVVKKGSEAEDMFKKLEARSNSFKTSLAPLALEFVKMVDSMLGALQKLKKAWDESGPVQRMRDQVKYGSLGEYSNLSPAEIARAKGQAEYPSETRFLRPGAKENLPPIIDPAAIEKEMKEGLDRAKKIYEEWKRDWFEGQEAPKNFEWVKEITGGAADQIRMLEAMKSEMNEKWQGVGGDKRGPKELVQIFTPKTAEEIAAIDADIKQIGEDFTKWVLRPTVEFKAVLDSIPHFEEVMGYEEAERLGKQAVQEVRLELQRLYEEAEYHRKLSGLGDPGAVEDVDYLTAERMGRKAEQEVRFDKIAENEKKAAEEAKKWADAIESGIDVFGRALMNLDNGWKGFFQTLAEGFARLIQDISMAILKAQLLEAVGLGKGGGGGTGGFNPFSLFGGGGGTSPTAPSTGIPEFPAAPMSRSLAPSNVTVIYAMDRDSMVQSLEKTGAVVEVMDRHLQNRGRLVDTIRSVQ